MNGLVWINGKVGPLEQATISLHDRGYLFGDGVYELIKVYNGKAYTIPEHIKRLERSLKGVSIKVSFKTEEWISIINRLVDESGLKEAYVYIQVTRGICPRLHNFSKDLKPSIIIYVCEMSSLPNEKREDGVLAITVPDERWSHPNLKTINLLPNVLAKQTATEVGAHEALFVDAEGNVREGASSNIFAVFGDTLVTPPTDGKILPGVTRQVIMKICKKNKIYIKEECIQYKSLLLANEAFISSTGSEIIGVVKLDGKVIGDGKPGSITKKIFALYMQDIYDSATNNDKEEKNE
ncbi:MAG: hypothetical protein APF84_02425 [Gracilibacter sp. BRH_c7a]|nr:MAG: hypothetical protein APF84_02425 [Gracilibacter sp. BRH_c7a]